MPRRARYNPNVQPEFEALEPRLLLADDLAVSLFAAAGGATHPFDSIEVQFTEGVKDGTFTSDDVHVLDQNGNAAATTVTKLADDRYRIDLTTRLGLSKYSVSIGPDIQDASGVLMNQDHDATPGEADDAYLASLVSGGLSVGDTQTDRQQYDNRNILAYGGAGTIAGAHQFADLELQGGASVSATGPTIDVLDLMAESGSTLTIAGGGTLTAAGTISLKGGSTLVAEGKNTTAQVGGVWVGLGVAIDAVDILVDATSKITADGKGYAGAAPYYLAGAGPGAGLGGSGGGTGAGYGGIGGVNTYGRAGGGVYGSPLAPTDLGSGGGSDDHSGDWGGNGGGAIRINASGTLTLDGTISANGVNGGYDGGGAGSGGSIWVTTHALIGSGTFKAVGGNGPNTSWPGGGGGGRVAVAYDDGAGFTGFGAPRIQWARVSLSSPRLHS